MNRFSLEGTTALVTGATGHLGRHMCQALGEHGARLMLVGRDERKLHSLVQELSEIGIRTESYVCDLLKTDAASRINDWLCGSTESLDILVNNAHGVRQKSRIEPEATDFQQAFRFAVSFPYEIVREVLPLLKNCSINRKGGASIIQISSIYGINSPHPQVYGDTGLNSPVHYGSAKAGMLQLTRHMAIELAPHSIRVNSLVLGPFPVAAIGLKYPDFKSRLEEQIPLGRCGEASEVGGPLVFLASSASSYCTGISLSVDGGWAAW